MAVKRRRLLGISLFCAFISFVSSCIRYHAAPISAPKAADEFEARGLDSPEIQKFFRSLPDFEAGTPSTWDLRALTLAAIFYHHDMDVARTQWGIAKAGRITAGERPNPVLGLLMGYNSTTPVSEISPWIPEVSLEIPIETAGKRGYRIAQAQHLSEAARLNILSAAWGVRSRLRRAFLENYAAQETAVLLARQLELQKESLRILEAQLGVGEISPAVVTQARIALDQSHLAALEAAGEKDRTRAQLASAIGVPVKALEGVEIVFDELGRIQPDLPSPDIRRRALLHRADILGALAEYAASEAALRLEIAKQYPDINLTPDYQLDQTDSKWTLGLSLILPLLNRNKGPIAEAQARRAETGARFLALQAGVIGDLEAAVAASKAAADKARSAEAILTNLKRSQDSATKRYELGEISKLELLGVELELSASAQARLESLVRAQQAAGELEDAMQSPLDLTAWAFPSPAGSAGQAKERKHD